MFKIANITALKTNTCRLIATCVNHSNTRKDTKMPMFQGDIQLFFACDKGGTFLFFDL